MERDSQIKFKTSMLRSSFCDYSDTYILAKRLYQSQHKQDNPNNTNKKAVFKNCAPLPDCISEINNTQIDNAKHIDIIMSMYNLIEYSDNYSKTSGTLWQYYRDEPDLTDADAIANLHAADKKASFKFEQKITGSTYDGGTENLEIMVTLKY